MIAKRIRRKRLKLSGSKAALLSTRVNISRTYWVEIWSSDVNRLAQIVVAVSSVAGLLGTTGYEQIKIWIVRYALQAML